MLNRTDILKRMIEVRKSIYRKEMLMDKPPSLDDIKIRKEIDKVIMDIIGDGYSSEDKEHIDNILLRAICEDISLDMAMQAIREIVIPYYQTDKPNITKENKKEMEREIPKLNSKTSDKEEQLAAVYYQKGYR
ncbi:MAG: hypothetical protein ACLFUI_00785 [Halanaerobiales bacterium]